MLHVQESVNLSIYLYSQTVGQRRMLYIRIFYVVKNIYIDTGIQLQWRVTNMVRNDLRARGGGGLGGGRKAPPPTRCWGGTTPTASFLYERGKRHKNLKGKEKSLRGREIKTGSRKVGTHFNGARTLVSLD